MSAQRNTMWQARVRELLREGFGTEDIAILTETHPETVRREVAILRESGELKNIYRRQA